MLTITLQVDACNESGVRVECNNPKLKVREQITVANCIVTCCTLYCSVLLTKWRNAHNYTCDIIVEHSQSGSA